MNTKSTLILMLIALTIFPTATCAAEQKAAEDIETYIAQTKKRIEDFYDDLLIETKQRAEEQIISFREQEKAKLYETAIYFKDYAYVHNSYTKLEDGAMFPTKKLNAYQDRIDQYNKRVEELLELSIENLKNQRDHALNSTIPYLEKQLIKDIDKLQPTPGLITGIAYSRDKQLAIIGSQIFQPQDTIQGAKIIKITPDSIVFQKDDKTWTKKIGQSIITH